MKAVDITVDTTIFTAKEDAVLNSKENVEVDVVIRETVI